MHQSQTGTRSGTIRFGILREAVNAFQSSSFLTGLVLASLIQPLVADATGQGVLRFPP